MVSLALDPPPYREGRSPRRGGGRRTALVILLAVAVGAGFAAGRWTAPGGRFAITSSSILGHRLAVVAAPAPGAAPVAPPSSVAPGAPGGPAGATAAAPAPAVSAGPAATTPAVPSSAATVAAGPRRVVVTLSGPLEEAITAAVPAFDRALAPELTQVVNRLLVWNLRVARDGRRGDKVEIVYAPPPGGNELGAQEPLVEALRYDSQKLAAVISAYRFRAPGARWARYYRPDGTELEERLVDTPMSEYDQITSLLRDGRRHKGVDFRVPVGTPVVATFDGVIERRNWNWSSNGNCLDVRDPATGRHAIYLHLDVLPKDVVPGRRVKKGEQIATSGNSGRSFAPHLHFQLEDASGKVLDPFEVMPVRRAALDPAARAAFDAERARLDGALSGNAVANVNGSTGSGAE